MTDPVNRMAHPGPLCRTLESDIVQNEEKVNAYRRESRCKVIQAIALSALFIIAAVAAFVLTSIFAPNYAPIVLFVGGYLLIDKMAQYVRTHFKDKWKQLDSQAEQLQAIGKMYLKVFTNTGYQDKLKKEFKPANADQLKKYIYLDAHYQYWQEAATDATKMQLAKYTEAMQIARDPTKNNEEGIKKYFHLQVRTQQLREEVLHAKVQAAYVRAIMKRPDCIPTDELFRIYFAPIPLQKETDGDLSVNVSLLESPWAQRCLRLDLPPHEDTFFVSTSTAGRSFSRAEILSDKQHVDKEHLFSLDLQRPRAKPVFDMMVDEIVFTMDEQMALARQALNQSRGGNGAQQLEGLAQNA